MTEPDVNRAIADLEARYATAFQSCRILAPPNRSTVLYRLAVCHEAAMHYLTDHLSDPASSFAIANLANGFQRALHLITSPEVCTHPAIDQSLENTSLQEAAEFLSLAWEYDQFRRHVNLLERRLIIASCEGTTIHFRLIDDFGVMAGRQAILEFEEASRAPVPESWPYPLATVDQRFPTAARLFHVDETAFRRLLEWLEAQPAVKELEAVSATATVGPIGWSNFRLLWHFVVALGLYLFLLAEAERKHGPAVHPSVLRDERTWRNLVFPGGTHELLPAGSAHLSYLKLLAPVWSLSFLKKLAVRITGLPEGAVRRFLDMVITGATQRGSETSRLMLRFGPARALLVPQMLMYSMGDPDALPRFISRRYPQAYSRHFACCLSQAPTQFASFWRQELGRPRNILIEKKIKSDGRVVGAIDIGVYEPANGCILLFEFKSLWLFEDSSAQATLDALEHAATQLVKLEEHLRRAEAGEIRQLFGLSATVSGDVRDVHKVIVTRRSLWAGVIRGIPVLSHAMLRQILSDASGDVGHIAEVLDDAQAILPGDLQRVVQHFKIGDLTWSMEGWSPGRAYPATSRAQ